MAITIPTPEDQGASSLGGVEGQAAQTPYQNLQLPDLAFNARTLGQLGGVFENLSREASARYEEIALLEVQQAYSEFERDYLYNTETGIMRTEKADARGITDKTREVTAAFFDQYKNDNRLITRSARMAVEKFAQQRQISLLDTVAQHELSESEKHRAALKAAAAQSAINAASVSFVSDARMAETAELIRTSTASEFADDPSVSPETVAEITASRIDQMHREAIIAALLLDTKAGKARAQELYVAALESGELKLKENDPISRAVTFATEEDGRSAAADMLLAQADGNIEEAIRLADQMPNANATDRAKIIDDLEGRFSVQERAAKAAEAALVARATELALNQDLLSMPAAERAQLPTEVYNRLLEMNKGGPPISDPTAVNFLNSLSDLQWASVDMSAFAGKLTADDLAAFSKEQADTAAKLRTAKETQTIGRTTSQLVEDFANRAGLSGSDKAAQRATFTTEMNIFVRDYMLSNDGKEPSQEELAVEADRLMLRVVTEEGVFSDTKRPVAEVLSSPPALVDDAGNPVPRADVRAFIRAVVEMQGETAMLTPEALQALYLNYLASR